MGRAAKFDREAAVETCMHDMWRFGSEACSVKSLSERLGITRSSFYNAFGSREALFLEVLEEYAQHIPSRSLSTESKTIPIKRLLTDFFQDVCCRITSDPEARGCLGVNSIAELVGVDEKLGPVIESAILHSFNRFEKLLEAASVKGEIIDDGQLRNKALSLQNLMLGLCMMSKIIHSYEDLKAVADMTLKGLDLFEEEQG
jgi:TetR/AcrR family transcriptional repressor of nem operon